MRQTDRQTDRQRPTAERVKVSVDDGVEGSTIVKIPHSCRESITLC